MNQDLPRLSDQAARSLAGARFWARLVGLTTVMPCALLSLALLLMCVVSLARHGTAPRLTLLVWLAVVQAPAMLALTYAARLGHFARGDRTALTGAFRALRVFWILTTIAYGLVAMAILGIFPLT